MGITFNGSVEKRRRPQGSLFLNHSSMRQRDRFVAYGQVWISHHFRHPRFAICKSFGQVPPWEKNYRAAAVGKWNIRKLENRKLTCWACCFAKSWNLLDHSRSKIKSFWILSSVCDQVVWSSWACNLRNWKFRYAQMRFDFQWFLASSFLQAGSSAALSVFSFWTFHSGRAAEMWERIFTVFLTKKHLGLASCWYFASLLLNTPIASIFAGGTDVVSMCRRSASQCWCMNLILLINKDHVWLDIDIHNHKLAAH